MIVLFLIVLVHMRLHLHTSLLLLTILCPMLLLTSLVNSHYFGAVFRFFFKRSCLGLTFGCCTQPCTCKIDQVVETETTWPHLVQHELHKESARIPLAVQRRGMSTWQRTVAPAAEVNVYRCVRHGVGMVTLRLSLSWHLSPSP